MKRANGTGSIVKKKERANPYLVYAPAERGSDGKRVSKYLGSFKKKIDAQNFLDEYIRTPHSERQTLTFKQVYEEFKLSKQFKNLSANSKSDYTNAYRHCLELNNIIFVELRTIHMQNIIDRMEASGCSKSLVNKVKLLFGRLYDYAIQTDVTVKDYSDFVVLPTIEEKERRALTDEEIEKIKKAAEKGSPAAELTLYLLYSGWRISEMLELTIFNYDPKEKVFIGGKKTKNGKNRTVPVHPTVQPIVDKYIAYGADTIFCRPSDKRPMDSHYFRRYMFNKMLKELNLDKEITPHYTRHTFATKLKQNGADEFYRKRLLGHASGDVTNDVYTHADIEGLRKAILHFEGKPEEVENNNIMDMKTKSAS